ncbi:MAG: alpha/beta hydrolase [Halieaceae bacterium]
MPASAAIHPEPPKLSHSLLELGRFALEMGSAACLGPLFRLLPEGDGHAVMTLPGFMGADGSTASLRRFLRRQGYAALPWGQGRNLPEGGIASMIQALDFRQKMEQLLAARLEKEVMRSGGRVSLVGWSLGGLYATGMAHRYPQLVRQVITLGTPFGDPRATSIYSMMQRMYQGEVDAKMLDDWIGFTFEGELEVPVSALYSTSDGFVGESIARLPEHPLMENIAVMASHVGFPFNPLVKAVIAERLAQAEGDWQAYRRPSLKPFLYSPD